MRLLTSFRRLLRPAGLAILGGVASILTAQAAGGSARGVARPVDTVILISVDGLRWDHTLAKEAPNLARMRAEGVSASRLIPPFPSNTFPSHATLVTGAHPDRHGVINNRFLDRDRGVFQREGEADWLLVEPLWAAAERQGIRTAVQHWVCASTPWRGVSPTHSEPFKPGVRDSTKVGVILKWLRTAGPSRPRLILTYLGGVDAAGHREGPGSEAVRRRIGETDRLIGRLIEEMQRHDRPIALVVVSDHGQAAVSKVHRLDRLLRGEASEVRSFSSGATANLYCPGEKSCRAAEEALNGIGGIEIYRREDLPDRLRYDNPLRTGDLVAIAPSGSYFADQAGGAPARGMHGFDPDREEMHGVFHAWGAGLNRGAVRERVRSIDVAPFVSRLLGIEPPRGSEGVAPADLLEPLSPDRESGDPEAYPQSQGRSPADLHQDPVAGVAQP